MRFTPNLFLLLVTLWGVSTHPALAGPPDPFEIWGTDFTGKPKYLGRYTPTRGKIEKVIRVDRDGHEMVTYRLSEFSSSDPGRTVDLPADYERGLNELSMFAKKHDSNLPAWGVPRPDGNVQVATYSGRALILGTRGEIEFAPLLDYAESVPGRRTNRMAHEPALHPVGLPRDWINRVAIDAGTGPSRVMLLDYRKPKDRTERARVLTPDVFEATQNSPEPLPPEKVLDASAERLIYLTDAEKVEKADAIARRNRERNIAVANPYQPDPLGNIMDGRTTEHEPAFWVDPLKDPARDVARRRARGITDRIEVLPVVVPPTPKPADGPLAAFLEFCRIWRRD